MYFSGDQFDAHTHIFGFTLKCKLWIFDPQFIDWVFQYFMIFTRCWWGKTRKRDSHPVRVNLQSCFVVTNLVRVKKIFLSLLKWIWHGIPAGTTRSRYFAPKPLPLLLLLLLLLFLLLLLL